MVAIPSPGAREQYEAARHRAAIVDRSDRGRIVVSGKDRASYLQGLLTNDIAALSPGDGCYTAYLTPQGRMISDLWIYELGDEMLIVLSRLMKDRVLTRLDQSIFAEDVQLRDASDTSTSVAVVGPAAAEILGSVLTDLPADGLLLLGEHGNTKARFDNQLAIVLRLTDTGERGYEVSVDAAHGPRLTATLAGAGAIAIDRAAAETLRIEAGIPRFHLDMDEQTIPLEAGIEERAISFTKGCFVGQEVIVRVMHRGHGRVARKLVGLTLENGDVPPPGTSVRADGRDLGRITSSVWSPALERSIALAYVHREFAGPGTMVTVDGTPAVVTALPFVGGRADAPSTG